jgi:hypothetical protein
MSRKTISIRHVKLTDTNRRVVFSHRFAVVKNIMDGDTFHLALHLVMRDGYLVIGMADCDHSSEYLDPGSIEVSRMHLQDAAIQATMICTRCGALVEIGAPL